MGEDYAVALNEARKRLDTEITLNRLVKSVRGDERIPLAVALEEADQALERVDEPPMPLPLVLHCPRCGTQHIDEPAPGWDNPPHRSHACQKPGCLCVWRPADVPTTGVAAIATAGKADNWAPGDTILADRP
jgi:hypothetical protein